MVVLIVNDTELAGGNAMDFFGGMDDESSFTGLLQSAGEIFGGMTDFEGDISALHWGGEPMDVMDGEIMLIG